jgi:pyruvate,orthophosphate dikinase
LVSCRSGAKFSMPGMMNTILNLGLNDESVEGIARLTNNPRFAYDSYRRFIQMFGEVALDIDMAKFDHIFDERKKKAKVKLDTDLSADDLRAIIVDYKKLVQKETKKPFPQDAHVQLAMSRDAVFRSWWNPKASYYRKMEKISDAIGTAASVQAMVFGNLGESSATGVGFTRDPATGEKVFYGEFLINAQGEDVVAGVRTPEPVALLKGHLPAAFAELEIVRKTLESHFKDVQDFEFTIQDGKLFMLQTRNGKRTGLAAVRFAIEMEKEKLIDWKTAIRRVPADQLDQVLAPVFDRKAMKAAKCIAKGLPAGPGAACGKMYLNADRADAAAAKGEKVLLVRNETSPEDLRGMIASEGILTAKGGVSSHAELVARQMGKVCVCGAGALQIDYATKTLVADGVTYKEGDFLSINGTAGNVYPGQLPTQASEIVTGLISNEIGRAHV